MPGRQRSRSTARAARVLAHVAPAGATGLGDWGSVSDAPRPSYYRAPRLEVGSSELKSHLGEHGYAVAKCVLSPSQCKAAISKLWDFLEACTSGLIDRRDVKTWRDEHWPASGAGATFLSAYGAEHSDAAWYVRGIPRVKQCFAALHGTDELLVSFDAICAHRPWWHPGGDRNWRCKSGFFHADQTAVSRGRFIEPLAIPDSEPDYIQGAVNLLPMSEHTGGHCLVPNSHIHFTELMAKHNIHSNGFPIPPTEPVLAKSIIPHMEAGDMLLFDTRTIQTGAPGLRPGPASAASAELLHVEVYVTMSPKSKASKATIAQRHDGYQANAAFGCHAAHHLLAQPPSPASAGSRFVVVAPAKLSPEMLDLVG